MSSTTTQSPTDPNHILIERSGLIHVTNQKVSSYEGYHIRDLNLGKYVSQISHLNAYRDISTALLTTDLNPQMFIY